MNIYFVYEINLWLFTIGQVFVLRNSLFGAVKLTKNADPDKYKYSGCGIGFNVSGSLLLPDGNGFGKNAIVFGADMSSSVHIDINKKGILILGKGPTQGLENTALTAEKEYSLNFTSQQKKFCLSLQYKGVNSDMFVNCVEIYKFKNSEINGAPLCLINISKDFSADNMKKTELHVYVYDISVDYYSIYVDNILDIHKYLMVKNNIK